MPRLVALGGSQTVTIGLNLAEAGVAMVLAQNGYCSPATLTTFLPAFFAELLSDGQADRAAAAARSKVADQPDWWMPILLSRVKSGQLW